MNPIDKKCYRMKPFYIPGIPIKYNNPCIDPLQHSIPHIIFVCGYSESGECISAKYEPNMEHYSEYSYLIQKFIDSEKLNDQ